MSLIAHHLGQLDEISTPGEILPTLVAKAAEQAWGAGSALCEIQPPRGYMSRLAGLCASHKTNELQIDGDCGFISTKQI